MATYEYDEAGVMAAYFIITFLAMVLVPLTISSLTKISAKGITDGCQCTPCVEQREAISKQERGSLLNPKISRRTYFLLGGWSLFAFVCYRVSLLKVENKIYNPFEILGISTSMPEKDIKSHFKKLSKQFHPDKVKATANMTIEAIQDRFVEITKAYKSLTDERIKENWIKYNHPDGPQSTSMGIALPKWIIEGKNRIWVMAAYGLVFGGALPALVGRWWFGNRQKTKDGIHAQSAAAFFKTIKEESSMEEVVGALGKAYQWELPVGKSKSSAEIDALEKTIKEEVGAKWTEVRKIAQDFNGELHESRRQALVLIYAHLLRLEVKDAGLKKKQQQVLLQTPMLLNALLNVSVARTWLLPTLSIMRLYGYLAQAIPTNASQRLRLTQLPHIKQEDITPLPVKANDMSDVLASLEEKDDPRTKDVKKALEKWGRVDIVSATFKVIGERIVTPSSIIYLLVKLRITPPGSTPSTPVELTVDETKKAVQLEEEIDEKFLASRLDAEELPSSKTNGGAAHAPFWPGTRKPSWWIVLADDKSNRVVVPPMKITDIPYSQPGSDRDYRSYKIQFQGPPNTGLFTWKVYIVSDTFVGEEATTEISLKIEDPPAAEEAPSDEDISEPDEDTIAGQMAMMRGGKVKKRVEEESEDESSGTDDDKNDTDSSDSDSD
ncbi:Translocation protein sec63 [Psilocybe cubensis]|uniref:J domain-containing protein n=2 Tax=Psilocybe cubensis TaxID=181762 RepID=A0A8H7Y225_PSICU|nr:Translocation protein sec63 [Psilocybe cubensis]KAH9483171.1 Translocation protein sec63 [Psilocybe cubensis]